MNNAGYKTITQIPSEILEAVLTLFMQCFMPIRMDFDFYFVYNRELFKKRNTLRLYKEARKTKTA